MRNARAVYKDVSIKQTTTARAVLVSVPYNDVPYARRLELFAYDRVRALRVSTRKYRIQRAFYGA